MTDTGIKEEEINIVEKASTEEDATTKEASVAGTFYPANAVDLINQIERFKNSSKNFYKTTSRAVIVPHAGLIFSGQLAYDAINLLDKGIKNLFIFAPAHKVAFEGLAVSSFDKWETPLGKIELNREIIAELQEKFGVKKDINGNIIYPILISNNLRILNLGTIVHDNKNYHSEKNIFPIGYKSVREHTSMFSLDRRAEYTCEILNGGQKPQYKVTSSEDPDHPIIKDSSTACWSVVGNAINKLQGNKRKKVTISGTERFGLCDSKVSRLLANLPNADIVIKQMSKYNEDDNKKKK